MKKGFTVLYSILITSAILSASLGVYNVVFKQLQLASIGRESQRAFYAADTGLECALYWDIRKRSFSPGNTIKCAGSNIVLAEVRNTFSFEIQLDGSSPTCAKVFVDKSASPATKIDSSGYNSGCNLNNPRLVERSLRATY